MALLASMLTVLLVLAVPIGIVLAGSSLIFILFDMEMVFMYPWAVVFFEVGWKAFMEMGMFITILVLGILYAWRERAFEWE